MAARFTWTMNVIKCLLYLINTTFMLTGLMIFYVGWQIYQLYGKFAAFLSTDYVNPSTVLMVIGCLVWAIAICGIFGASKESTCMVNVFTFSLTLILIVEFSVILATLYLQDDIKDALEEKLKNIFGHYFDYDLYSKATDYLQSTLQCCGMNGPHDWEKIGKNNLHPDSCCAPKIHILNKTTYYEFENCEHLYRKGCYEKLEFIIDASVIYVISGACAVVLTQLAGIIFAASLAKEIRAQKTLRERRRWEIRESMITGQQEYGLLNDNEKIASFPTPP